MDVEQHGTGGVGVIGNVHTPLGHLPDEPGIDGTEQEFAAFCTLAGAFNVIQNPLHFGAREVRIHHQTGGAADVIFHAVALELLADFRRTTALPDDGVVDWFTGFTFPDNRGFTLVGDTNRRDFIGTDVGFRQHFDQR
ncbi:hypothetical protein D3C80_1172170 [compost metagenome]